MEPEFEVIEYSIEAFEKLLSKSPPTSINFIRSKFHRDYFKDYFDTLGTKTIISENHYIDRDFLEDFSGYYVRCFQQYNSKCRRFHFFNILFTQSDFNNLLLKEISPLTKILLQESYLGFIVAKPLPKTRIGRTCLKPYPSDNGRRNFPTARTYSANLFGIELSVNSLAYQEQDHVAAACATSALWTIFHGTGYLFHHHIPSPVEITKSATAHTPILSRAIPNKDGLTGEQMAHAIHSIDLEPLHAGFQNEHILKSSLYAYLRAKIPSALGLILFDTSVNPPKESGHHAVAVTGYSLGHPFALTYNDSSEFILKSSRIDKIYVHDDQIGPFARMVFKYEKPNATFEGKQPEYYLSTSWKGSDKISGSVIALPYLMLTPLYHKIRIPFEVVHTTVINFNLFINLLRDNGRLPQKVSNQIEWDIYLTTVNDLKTDIESSSLLSGAQRKRVLTYNMPHYIWRATAICNDKCILDLIFDTTDIEQGSFFVKAIEYDYEFCYVLREITKAMSGTLADLCDTLPSWKILDWFSNRKFII